MTEDPAATPEKAMQPTPYNAQYDAKALIDSNMIGSIADTKDGRKLRDIFAADFKALIGVDLTRLLAMKARPTDITADDVKAWLSTTHMRYHEEPSEILPTTVVALREKVALLRPDSNISHINDLINTLEIPWGYDEFGKQLELRRIWEQEVASALKDVGVIAAVANSVHDLGGFFSLGSVISQIGGLIEELVDTNGPSTVGAELTSVDPLKFKEEVEQCDRYVDRVKLLKEYRAKLLAFMKEYIDGLLAQEQKLAIVEAELNDMLIGLGLRPKPNANSAEPLTDIP